MVHFANPAALWLLTLILPLLLLYLLKHKRRDQIVPSLLLWKQAIEDFRAQTPFQKLRSNLLLLLQILILVLLTALLSQPYISHASQESSRWILILDASASMKSTDESPDRFRVARERLLKTLATIAPVDEVMLIVLSSEASILQSFSRNHAAVRSQILAVQPEDVGEDWGQLQKILEPLLKQKPRPRIVIASDFSHFPSTFQNEVSLDPICVGHAAENLAFTKVALEPLPEDPRNQILFFELRNFGKESKAGDLEVQVNDDLVDAYEISLAPSQSIHRSRRLEIDRPSRITLVSKSKDFLSEDNDITLEALPEQKVKVQVNLDNPFLARALKVLPGVGLSTDATLKISRDNSISRGIVFQTGRNQMSSQIVQWNSAHPILRFVDAGLWRFSKFTVLELPEGAESLMETVEGPVAYALEREGERSVVLGFLLEDSNVPLLAGFPVFLQNAIQWAGEPLHQKIPITTGNTHKNEGPFLEKNVRGFANFIDDQESSIAPRQINGGSGMAARLISIRRDLSMWFLLCLLSVVILEWWAFHQKYEV